MLGHSFQGWQRIHKKRGRPTWQDRAPKEKAVRLAWDIAARNEPAFARSFLDAVLAFRVSLDRVRVQGEFEVAYNARNLTAALQSLPLDATSSAWREFIDSMKSAYRSVIEDAGSSTAKDLARFNVRMGFSLVDRGEIVAKETAKKLPRKKFGGRAPESLVPVVPVNPYAVKWIEQNALDLVTQGLSLSQRETVRTVIEDGFRRGLRAEEAYQRIKDNIGLTDREAVWASNRYDTLIEEGWQEDDAKQLASKYRDELLEARAERIARTETFRASAEGRSEAWQLAQDEGLIQPAQMVRTWIAAPSSPNPSSPCELCLALDGLTAPIGEPYRTENGDEVAMPPSHPQCRCSESLDEVPGWKDGV